MVQVYNDRYAFANFSFCSEKCFFVVGVHIGGGSEESNQPSNKAEKKLKLLTATVEMASYEEMREQLQDVSYSYICSEVVSFVRFIL